LSLAYCLHHLFGWSSGGSGDEQVLQGNGSADAGLTEAERLGGDSQQQYY